nr:TPA_asm: hypothetical protein HUJ06_003008 [Nelumbo nucifera]
MLSELDDELVLTCESKLEEEEANQRAAAEKRRLTWERLENVASIQPMTGNTAVLVTPATAAIAC